MCSTCIDCTLFNTVEGEGWEDTGNGFYIIHCTDGQPRAMRDGCRCPAFDKSEWAGIKDVQ